AELIQGLPKTDVARVESAFSVGESDAIALELKWEPRFLGEVRNGFGDWRVAIDEMHWVRFQQPGRVHFFFASVQGQAGASPNFRIRAFCRFLEILQRGRARRYQALGGLLALLKGAAS